MAKGTVLIVDDQPDTRQIVAARLKKHEYHAVFASDCYQAVSMARQSHPDLILLDLHLPGGDGYLVLQRLRAITALASVPVVVMSSDDPAVAKQAALEAGAMAYLHKPVEEQALLSTVKAALDPPDPSGREA